MIARYVSALAPGFCILVMAASLLLFVVRYFRVRRKPLCAPRTGLPDTFLPVMRRVLFWFLVSRALVLLASFIGAWVQGEWSAFWQNPTYYWVRWDAPHYLGLAENGYVNEGDPRFHIVFYPLYPMLVRLLNPLFGGITALTASVLSNLCLLGSGWFLYSSVRLRSSPYAASRALRYLMLSPLTVFFSVPYTESLFLLLTCAAVYWARRERFLWAIVAGALAANTRLLGLLTAVPIFYEMLRKLKRTGAKPIRALGYAFLCCGVFAGFLGYLYLNWRVTGDPFRFLIYQAEHWGQRFGSIWQSFSYTVNNAFSYSSEFWRIGTWIPQAVAMVLALVLLLVSGSRAYPADAAYAWLYLFAGLAPTWLLSGPRYLSASYAMYPLLAIAGKRRAVDIALSVLSALGLLYFSYSYVIVGNLL